MTSKPPRNISHEIARIPRPGRSIKIRSAVKRRKFKQPVGFQEIEAPEVVGFSPQRVIQTICEEIRGHTRGKVPGVVQVLGAATRMYRQQPELLGKVASYMVTTEMYRPHDVIWRGTSRNAQYAIKERMGERTLLDVVTEKVKEYEGFPISSRAICLAIGKPWTAKNQQLLNAAFQVLEGGGFIRKLPQETQPNGRPITVWTYASPENPAILYPNTAMEILNRTHIESGIHAEELFKEYTKPGRGKEGNPHATFSRRTIFYVLERLEHDGMITLRKEWVKLPGRKPANRIYVQLTRLGEKLMEQYRRTGKLPEQMRIKMLGKSKKV